MVYIILYILVFALTSFYYWVINRYCEQPITFDDKEVNLLEPDSTIKFTPLQLKEHNEQLRAELMLKLNLGASGTETREASQRQMRAFYVLVFSGLLSIVLTRNFSDSFLIICILTVIVVALYAVEVHQIDLNDRAGKDYKIHHRELNTLTNSISDNQIWKKFNYDNLEKKKKKAFLNNKSRIIIKMYIPTFEQLILYIYPFVFLLTWLVIWVIKNGFTCFIRRITLID